MKIGVPSLEFIALQSDPFFNNLKECVDRIRSDDKFTTKTVFESGLEKVIFDRLGLSVQITIVDQPRLNAAIALPSIDKNHIFWRTLTTQANNDIGRTISYFQDDKMRIGSIDIDRVYVSGIFQRIPLPIYIYRGLLSPEITSGEVAATLLHELGHGFSFFYYLLHTATANFISCNTATAIAGASGDKDRSIIIERGCRMLGLDGVSVKEILSQTPEQIAATLQTLYINNTVNNLRSETGFGMYEIRACEQLADWFAAKFGCGIEAATLQEKLLRDGKRIVAAYTARNRTTFRTAVYYGAYAIQFTIPFPKIFSEIAFDDTISRYDTDIQRIKYMRQSMIDDIRNGDYPPEVTAKMIADIEAIKIIEDRLSKEENTFTNSIVKFLKSKIIPNYRRHVSAVELQKTIEEAMYNDSYVYAAKLKGALK